MKACPAFVDETGVLSASIRAQPVYGIGLLIVPDPSRLTDALYKTHFNLNAGRRKERAALRRQIREEDRQPSIEELDRLMWTTQHHEYKFSAVTSHNLQEYVDLLNVFFAHSGPEFHALMVDRSAGGYRLARWGDDPWSAYCHLTKELLSRRLRREVFAIVDLQGKPDRAREHLEDVLCSIPSVTGCLRATSETSIFLQLVDVLVGCVQFDMRDQRGLYTPTSHRADAKRKLAGFVKGNLD